MKEAEVFESIMYHKLRVCPEFKSLTLKKFKEIYNGYGPDKWPSVLRAIITWIFDLFPELAGSHDVSFHFSTGTRKGFEKTISDWKYNKSLLLNKQFPWSSPSLYFHRAAAWVKLTTAQKAVSGADAYKFYLEAYAKRMREEAKDKQEEQEGLLS